jgi:hypothetical protein
VPPRMFGAPLRHPLSGNAVIYSVGVTGRQDRAISARTRSARAHAHCPGEAHEGTARGHKAATAHSPKLDGHTRQELYAKAKRKGIEGRSRMTKRQLENAFGMR